MNTPQVNDVLGWMQKLLRDYWPAILSGIGKTMIIAVIGTFLGCLIGFAVGLIRTIPIDRDENPSKFYLLKLVRGILHAYVEIFRGTPMMVQAAFIHYGMGILFNVQMNIWTSAIIVVSINTGAYMAETVRGGIFSVDPGQGEAAAAIGMRHSQSMIHIILPQALRNILPQIGNNLIINIKDTCVLSIIGVSELFYTIRSMAGTSYAFFSAFSIAMMIYFVLTFICSRLLLLLEKRIDGPDSYELTLADGLVTGEGMPRFPQPKAGTNQDYIAVERLREQDELKEGRR